VTPERVWLIDDTDSNRRVYGEVLRTFGYAVDTFCDGRSALDAAEQGGPDLVVLDVRMPGMDGFECCRRLRHRWGEELIPIVMLTAVERREDYVRGLEAGADDYLIQPIDFDELRVRVRSLLRLRELYVELRAAKGKLAARVDELRQEIEARDRARVITDRLAAIGQIAAAVVHEINNPLAYVGSNIDACIEALPAPLRAAVRGEQAPPADGADCVAALQAVRAGFDRIRDVVRDVSTFSRGGADTGGCADVRAVIDSATNMAHHGIRQWARIVKQVGDGGVHAAIPASRLAQVLLNLVVNAAHAIEDRGEGPGEIAIRAGAADGRVTIEVADTGAGIPAALLERIFDPFYTSKGEGRGTGLGLAICRDLVTAAGGAITVESQVGRGSTFRITLPAATPPPPATLGAPPTPVRAVPTRGDARIAIIDDEPLVVHALARMLPGYRVRTFTRVDEAASHLDETDVILCDIMMPGRTGIDLYESSAPHLQRRFIFITGGAYSDRARAFLEGVPNPALEKPVDPGELAGAVADVLHAGADAPASA
jgi:signal transduction histidine kinase